MRLSPARRWSARPTSSPSRFSLPLPLPFSRLPIPSCCSSIVLAALVAFAAAPAPAAAITFTPAPAANLDLSNLGRVALAGDFSGISLFQYVEQTENPYNTNGSESLLARLPNGGFVSVAATDASIQSMCAFTLNNRTEAGLVLGGNFTSLGGLESTAIALFNPNTSAITRLSGLSGSVSAVLCDQDTNSVYVGGNFVGANSTNAIAWVGGKGWTNLPFAGFNGPVTSITKASNSHIIFGGSFTGLGNTSTPNTPDGQVINLSSANITASGTTSTAGFNNPSNIICKTDGTDGSGNTWLLADNEAGFWEATFGFGFRPTKLRLYNTHENGRGTETWRFTALPLGGIMNFTYIDPDTGANATCTSECPLSSKASVTYQDFHFVDLVGMNQFRLDISAWYGSGGGLDGIELFEDDIFVYAINDFNEPTCAGLEFASTATTTGAWTVTPSHSSASEYLTAELSSPITASSATIVFSPDIRQSGHYSVNVYTPGCLQDNTCSTRGQFVVSGQMTANTDQSTAINQTLFQTNDFDKYDQIYFGTIDASSTSFRPQITMAPLAGQSLTTMNFVAQRVGFTLINSTGGLNGLFEYDPSSAVVNTSDFSSSAFDMLGANFTAGSAVNTLVTSDRGLTFIGGNFTTSTDKNIVAMNDQSSTVQSLNSGLNGVVNSMIINGTNLYVGGAFTNSHGGSGVGLNYVAAYDTSKDAWSALGAGVNANVVSVVAMTMNVTSTTPEFVVAITGDFTQLESFGSNTAVTVNGFAVWVPSQGNWLQNLDLSLESINGVLTTSLIDSGGDNSFYAGSVSSSTLGVNGAASLISSSSLSRLPVDIQVPSSLSNAIVKRDATPNTQSGVLSGIFDTSPNRNLTILGGQFTATATNGSTINNLLIIDGLSDNNVTGIGAEISKSSTFLALAVTGDNLYAGGNVSGTVGGESVQALISYNLASHSFNTQPPSLAGGNGTVSTIAVRSSTGDVYVGGSFTSAGSLSCPGVCFFSASSSQWNQPGTNMAGTVNTMLWTTASTLVAGGNMSVNNTVTVYLAQFDASRATWDSYSGSVGQLPGPVTAVTKASSDASQLWVSGVSASNGSTYLMKYDGSSWQSATATFGSGTNIQGLQIFSLTQPHKSTSIMSASESLLITGSLVIPGYGAASATLYDGSTLTPFALTTLASGTARGSIAHVFVENDNFFNTSSSHLALVFIVLIGLAISLSLMLLIVSAGLMLDRWRREGYMPAPTSMFDRSSGMQRIPPHELLESLNKGRLGVPHV